MSAQLVPMDTNWSQWMLDETEESLTMYASSVVNNNDLNSFNNMVLYDNSFKKINVSDNIKYKFYQQQNHDIRFRIIKLNIKDEPLKQTRG